MEGKAVLKFFCSVAILFVQGTQSYDVEASITGLYTGPYFDPLAKKNLSAHLGDQAKIPCTVRQLGDKSVSWVRMRDADILTVDRYTFVGDERFESQYSEARETWSLIIKYVQERDAGLYECQVSTEPKMSQLFNLRVVIPKVSMMPPGDRYMKAGSRVQIDCQINDVVQLPDYIFWYHGDRRIMENNDPNILLTAKKTGVEAITSTLTILEVPAEASGNYTCMPSNLHSASVNLHVLNEKHPEAMQGERSSAPEAAGLGGGGGGPHHLHLVLFLLLCVLLSSASSFLGLNDANLQTSKEATYEPLGRTSISSRGEALTRSGGRLASSSNFFQTPSHGGISSTSSPASSKESTAHKRSTKLDEMLLEVIAQIGIATGIKGTVKGAQTRRGEEEEVFEEHQQSGCWRWWKANNAQLPGGGLLLDALFPKDSDKHHHHHQQQQQQQIISEEENHLQVENHLLEVIPADWKKFDNNAARFLTRDGSSDWKVKNKVVDLKEVWGEEEEEESRGEDKEDKEDKQGKNHQEEERGKNDAKVVSYNMSVETLLLESRRKTFSTSR